MGVIDSLRVLGLFGVVFCASYCVAHDDNHEKSPSLDVHLAYAECALNDGENRIAAAHAELVLMPQTLRLYLADSKPCGIEPGEAYEIIETSARRWEKILSNEVSFEFVSDRNSADIVISFEQNLKHSEQNVGGVARWKRCVQHLADDTYRYRMTATIKIRSDAPNGKPLPQDAMLAATMHEFGHLLGLQDSKNRGDLMGMLDLESPVSMPRRHEIEAIQKLRKRATELKIRAETKAAAQSAKYNQLHDLN